MHRRYRRRLSRLSYSVLGVAAGTVATALSTGNGPLSWQAILSYVALGAVGAHARRADLIAATVVRHPSGRHVSGRMDW